MAFLRSARLAAPFLLLPMLAAAGPGIKVEEYPPDTDAVRIDSALFEPLPGYAQVRSADFGGWADTGMYVGTQLGRYPQVHQVAAPGADRRQLTFFPGRSSGFYLNPDPKRRLLLYTSDEGGNEAFRIRLRDLRTGSDRVPGVPPGRVDEVVWNDSGTAFAYSHTPLGTDRWDLRLGRIGGRDGINGRDTLLLSLPGTWSPMDLRPDGKRLLVQKYVSASRAELYVLDPADGKLAPLLPGEKPAYAHQAQWMRTPSWLAREGRKAGTRSPSASGSAPSARKDSSWSVIFASDRDGGFQRLYIIGPDSGSKPVAWSHPADWDVEWANPDRERRRLIYSVNEDGYSRLYLLGPDRKEGRALTGIPDGVIRQAVFKPGSGTGASGVFAFALSNAAIPSDVYTYDLSKAKATRWTFSEPGGLDPAIFRTPKRIRYPTFDSVPAPAAPAGASAAAPGGRSPAPASPAAAPPLVPRAIPAWLYLPDPDRFPGARPTLIGIHGGPEAQARPVFDPFLQYLVADLGFAVVQPDVRGSTGYGRAWQRADDGYLRMNSVRDIGALIDWIDAGGAGNGRRASEPNWPDPQRLAVSGRSYGGFMSLSTLIEYGPKLRAGMSAVGIAHFPTFLAKTSGYRRDLRRVEYGDERDPRMARFLDSISPLTRIDRLRTPLLLSHGRNDPRVPYEESERIFAALKARKVPVRFLTFSEEGHAVRDPESQVAQWKAMAEFLIRELGAPDR
jgi:dipeptidyl aminopeptidase/acylaminoacyl peptidase